MAYASFNQSIAGGRYVFTPRNKLARKLCEGIEAETVTAGTLAQWARKHEIRLYRKGV